MTALNYFRINTVDKKLQTKYSVFPDILKNKIVGTGDLWINLNVFIDKNTFENTTDIFDLPVEIDNKYHFYKEGLSIVVCDEKHNAPVHFIHFHYDDGFIPFLHVKLWAFVEDPNKRIFLFDKTYDQISDNFINISQLVKDFTQYYNLKDFAEALVNSIDDEKSGFIYTLPEEFME